MIPVETYSNYFLNKQQLNYNYRLQNSRFFSQNQ